MADEQIFTWEGITLPSYWGGNLSRPGGQIAMSQIKATGASTVTIIPNFFQTDEHSNTVKLNLNPDVVNGSESDSFGQVTQAILDAKGHGLNVVVKPHLETDNRVWRADIAPSDPTAWFASYKAMMVEYAKAAQAGGASMICVGTEMKSMTDPAKVCSDGETYTQKWDEIIEAVRAEFSGQVTYAATYDEVTKVGFWDHVDYIGVDAYLPMSGVDNPTVDQMVDAWIKPHFNPWIRDTLYGGKSAVDYYKALSDQYGKQVLFTEVGYRSADGANKDPGVFNGSAPVDTQEQADCYTALYKVMENYGGQWLGGAFLWSYHPFENPVTDAGVPETDYTTQWKPANDVVTAHYSSPAHTTGVAWNGTGGSDKLDGGYHDDTLQGAAGNDTLWGGAGNDILQGGSGNDVLDGAAGTDRAAYTGPRSAYTVAANADGSVTVAGPDGTDLLKGMELIQFDGQDVDLGTLLSPPSTTPSAPQPPVAAGPAGLFLRGTAHKDKLVGHDGNDTLLGLAGNDTLYGYDGNDTLSGSAGNDTLKGLNGNDQLWGGAGKDVLTGGKGKDIFVFDAKPNTKTNLDKITDFNVKDDTLWLDNHYFTKLGKGSAVKPGQLNAKFFTLGDHAKDKDDYLIYDNKKGVLWYDADGSGSHKAIEIATLKKGLKMTYHDVFVI